MEGELTLKLENFFVLSNLPFYPFISSLFIKEHELQLGLINGNTSNHFIHLINNYC